MSNFISLYGAIKVNGLWIANYTDFLADCPASQIVSVQLTSLVNQNGTDSPCFWIRVINPQGLTVEDIYLQTHTGLTTLANFASGLTAQSATNTFTTYDNLVRTSDLASNLVASGTSVLLNDVYSIGSIGGGRVYNPNTDETTVYVNIKNRLSYTQYVFSGDQTYAGDYTYFTSSGNS